MKSKVRTSLILLCFFCVNLFVSCSDNVTFIISYNSNGATSGTVPAEQVKIKGEKITLSTNTGSLAKSGATFSGWNTSADGVGVHYNVGASYTVDSNITLYAEWSDTVTYMIAYNANEADSGESPEDQEKNEGATIVLSDNTGSLFRTGYSFTGWNTQGDGSGDHYNVGDSYSTDADLTLYAEWREQNAETILHASDMQAEDFFGLSVSMDGAYAIIGAKGEAGGAGEPASDAGAAYIYKNDGNDNWNEIAILHASDMQAGDGFGKSVSIDGAYAIIGASSEDGGIGDSASDAGAAYIFKNDGNDNWNEIAILHASDMQEYDEFGYSVSIDGAYAIVGARHEAGGAGDPFYYAGSAYIFKNDGSDNWNEIAILHASDMNSIEIFGFSVSIDGVYAIVGGYLEDGGTGDPAEGTGAAYIFKNDGSDNWNEIAILHASDMQEYDEFGYSVSIDGAYAIVGAHFEDGGVGDPVNAAGAAYIFKNDGNDNWNEIAILHASDMQEYDFFGLSVSINGAYVIVGSCNTTSSSVDPGAAYIFKNDGNDNWSEVAIIHASDKQANDYLGYSVSIEGTYAIVGAPAEDGGVGDFASDAGAAYIINDLSY